MKTNKTSSLLTLFLVALIEGCTLLAPVDDIKQAPDAATGAGGDGTGGADSSVGPDGNSGGARDGGDGGPYVPPECRDKKKNGTETDVDCGGGTCLPCAANLHCNGEMDCLDHVCFNGQCKAARCNDEVTNGGESDVDCGGTCPNRCAEGKECNSGSDCLQGVCSTTAIKKPDGVNFYKFCSPPSCTDHVRNNDETDVDCGGSCPIRCGDLKSCLAETDCTSHVCASHAVTADSGSETSDAQAADGANSAESAPKSDAGTVCQPATCVDGVLNGKESDLDCGGTACPGCPSGKICKTVNDCVNKVCTLGICQGAGCIDMAKNGNETDTDCGGDECAPCDDAKACLLARDCASKSCIDKVCQTAACPDGVTNGKETDLDCGGPDCAACDDGKACAGDTDCKSIHCVGSKCQAPTCGDGIKNQDESDIDCGGACGKCDDGKACTGAVDCKSAVCAASVCKAPACDDKVKNGSESDIDCGGGTCPKCALGLACGGNTDCTNGTCLANVCQDPTCANGQLDVASGETDIDCGGASCKNCSDGKKCLADGDCVSIRCDPSLKSCNAPGCPDGVKNGTESDTDCGGPGNCARCGTDQVCGAASDCQSGVCPSGKCAGALCNDGIKNGSETDVDCGGSCAPCAPGLICLQASDCDSKVCDLSVQPHVCKIPLCNDGVKNGGETDVDCGGPSCAGCHINQVCVSKTDCKCSVCTNGVCMPACGDGIICSDAVTETCDDGNATTGDGCTNCAVDFGYDCGVSAPSVCQSTCGDGKKATNEACDDGNAVNGDGCTGCAVDLGYSCSGTQPSACTTVCGDGIRAGGEACDDGNGTSGDGCSGCAVDFGFGCVGTQPSACSSSCGDGKKASNEACDDGNGTSGDGCSGCAVDFGYGCTGSQPSSCASSCGDGLKATNEACDDGNATSGDGCSGCTVDFGFACAGTQPSACGSSCGDGKKASNEACDDGNVVTTDGCSGCAISFGYTCTGTQPSSCSTTCGDGKKAGSEACDDGNGVANDGCTSCAINFAYTCTGVQPSVCSSTCSTTCDTTHSNGPTCGTGKCVYTGCVPGWGNCNTSGTDTNGCETATNTRANCNACGTICGATQICGPSACIVAPTAAIVTKWLDPTGWTDSSGNVIAMTFQTTGVAGTIYECRTGPIGTVGSLPWVACDGSLGLTAVYHPAPQPVGALKDNQQGTFRTEHRYRSDTYTSNLVQYDYYIHHSLDGVRACPVSSSDGPHFTDAQYFAAAMTYSTAHPAEFPTTLTFPVDGTVKLRNPFIQIPFVNLSKSAGMVNSGFWSLPLANPYIVKDDSLRHRFVVSGDNKLILRKRAYLTFGFNDCFDRVWFGSRLGHGGIGRVEYSCEALVVNRTGQALCISTNGLVPAAPKVLYSSLTGWQKLQQHPWDHHKCVGSPTCNDGAAGDQPFMLYLAP